MGQHAVAGLPALIALLLALPSAAQGPGAAPDSITRLSRAGRLEEAATLAAAAVAQAPGDAQANLRLGGILVRLARHDSAIGYLQKVILLPGAAPWQRGWARVQLGRARLALGDTGAAEVELREAYALRAGRGTEAEAAALLSRIGGHPALAAWSVLHTAHLRVHFPPDTRVEDPAAHAARLEGAYLQLRTFFGDLPGPAFVFVWNASAEAEAVMFRPLGFARPEYLVVHMRPEQTPGHELTHLFSFHAGQTTRRTRFIDEGTSVAFNLGGLDPLADARMALRVTGTREISVARLWEDDGSLPEPLLYPVAGAFVHRLIREGGRDRFLRLLARQTLEDARQIYGAELDGVIAGFERDLRRR